MTCSEKEKWDAELGRVAMRFVDRAGDVHPGIDDADRICQEFYEAMSAVINQMPHVRTMHTTATHPVQLPEPVAWMDNGELRAGSTATAHRVVTSDTKSSMPNASKISFVNPLYTEQQVRDILAQYVIN